jgi:hypothetical protein
VIAEFLASHGRPSRTDVPLGAAAGAVTAEDDAK